MTKRKSSDQLKQVIEPVFSSKLFCWDFDNTIIKGHSHDFFEKKGIRPRAAPSELIKSFLDNPDNGLKNPTELLRIFQTTLKNNHKIAITTLSEYPEMINPTLVKLGLTTDEIDKIKIIARSSTKSYPRKLKHIESAMEFFKITEEQQVWLIDDSEPNCSSALAKGYNAIQVLPRDPVGYLTKLREIVSSSLIDQDIIQETERSVVLEEIYSPPYKKNPPCKKNLFPEINSEDDDNLTSNSSSDAFRTPPKKQKNKEESYYYSSPPPTLFDYEDDSSPYFPDTSSELSGEV